MRAVLKQLRSLEAEDHPRAYSPADPTKFGTWIRLMVGPENEPGSEAFDVLLCTPDWLRDELVAEPRAMWGRHMLVVATYDLDAIEAEVRNAVQRCSGANWAEITQKLSKLGAWEFEDYRPHQSTSK